MALRQTISPDRLYQILNNTGLQNKDNGLYQLLFYLIGQVINLTNSSSGGGGGGGGSTTFLQQIFNSFTIGDSCDSCSGDMGPPGVAGADGANGMVPYFIATGETFTVPLYKQALFSMVIDNEGTLAIDGFLIEVD